MFSYRSLILVTIIVSTLSIDFTVKVKGHSTQCFYEHLTYQTKFNIEVSPEQTGRAIFTVTTLHDEDHNQDVTIYKRQLDDSQVFRVSKFAPATANYAFCLQNIINSPFITSLRLQSGLQMMEFTTLPDQDDKVHLDKQVEALEEQHSSLLASLKQVENAKSTTQEMLNLMSTKSIWFGILGLVTIILVNLGFQREVRKTLKQRKLI